MLTLIVQLTPRLAARLARLADQGGQSHEDFAREALRAYIRAVEAVAENPLAPAAASSNGRHAL